ncbi:glycosyltransferase family 4 protein [Vibrio vulnificus]|nr:glycosyltransferase family 4 protein [Vibrio vulnificus]ELB7645894.1 glycosyltransferase family 4 protein [Vibrio vulnificus]
MNKYVQIVGAVPKPIGGVSTYVYRLSHMLHDVEHEIVDLYFSGDKLPVPSGYQCCQSSGFINRLRFLWKSLRVDKDATIFFNFSSSKSLLLFLFILKGKSNWVIMLHNGDLNLPSGNLSIVKFIYKFAISRFDKIFYISSSQKRFYMFDLDCSDDRLIYMSSYIPASYMPEMSVKNASKLLPEHSEYILANGYFKSIYNFEFLLRFAKDNPERKIIIVVYGEPDREYEERIRHEAESIDNVVFMSEVEPQFFLELLRGCSVYARPNHVDSFGIGVADALSLGIPTVASTVCERTQGALLFDSNDYSGFNEAMKLSLQTKVTKSSQTNFDFKNDYKKLLGF